jgi:hypothetical protein
MLVVYFELCVELTERDKKFQAKSYARPVVVTITVNGALWNAVKIKMQSYARCSQWNKKISCSDVKCLST